MKKIYKKTHKNSIVALSHMANIRKNGGSAKLLKKGDSFIVKYTSNKWFELYKQCIIKLSNGDAFRIDEIYDDCIVDMTSIKYIYDSELGFNYHKKLFSVELDNFDILYDNCT
jgi:hypothetical protein